MPVQEITQRLGRLERQHLIPQGPRDQPGVPAFHLEAGHNQFGFTASVHVADGANTSFLDLGWSPRPINVA